MSGNRIDSFFEGYHGVHRITVCIYNGVGSFSSVLYATASVSEGEAGKMFRQVVVTSIGSAVFELLADIKKNVFKKVNDDIINSLEEFCLLVGLLIETGGVI